MVNIYKGMDEGFIHGQMEGNMMENIIMIKSMDLGFIFGRMGGSMKGIG